MRPSLSAGLLAVVASALPAAAQERVPPPAAAFPPAITSSVGIAAFAPRYESSVSGTEFSYGSSLVLAARADYPLTRRLGLAAEVMVAPLAKQRVQAPDIGRTVGDNIMVYGFHAGVSGRLKPGAPVFFQVGAGLTMASKHAHPDADGRPLEPHGGLTIGYDGSAFGRSNIRVTYSARLALPDAPDDTTLPIDEKSVALDHVIQVGLRFVPSRARRAGP